VQALLAPLGTDTLQITVNSDPDIVKEIDRATKTAEAEAAERERAQKQREAQFKVDTGLKVRAQ